jgi:hypothetical protein
MADFRFCETKKEVFQQFLDGLERIEMEIAIVQPPVTDSNFDYLRASSSRGTQYAKHNDYVQQVLQRYLALAWNTPEEAGLDASIFVDYGHFSPKGPYRFSELLSLKMREKIEQLKSPDGVKRASLYNALDGSAVQSWRLNDIIP